MRTIYTLVVTLVFCFSLFAVYNVGYERGKNKMAWENFREQNKRDSVVRLNYKKQKLEACWYAYRYGYTWGIIRYQTYNSSAWQMLKKDSVDIKKIFF